MRRTCEGKSLHSDLCDTLGMTMRVTFDHEDNKPYFMISNIESVYFNVVSTMLINKPIIAALHRIS